MDWLNPTDDMLNALNQGRADRQGEVDELASHVEDSKLQVENLRTERDGARTLVLRLVVSQYRDGWESGETEVETRSRALDALSNWDLDPHCNREACKEALANNPEVSLAQVRSNQEERESALRELKYAEDHNDRLLAMLQRVRPIIGVACCCGSGPPVPECTPCALDEALR